MGSPTLPPPRASYRVPNAPFLFVSVADMRQSKAPNAVLSTLGLGSCLGITCYDPLTKSGVLLHAMLPDSQKHRAVDPLAAMYLDLGVPAMIDAALQLGGLLPRLELKVFGGAQILQSNEYFSIGRQNIEMMRQLADRYHLRVKNWEVGGQFNRSIELHLASGRVLLRTPNRTETWI